MASQYYFVILQCQSTFSKEFELARKGKLHSIFFLTVELYSIIPAVVSRQEFFTCVVLANREAAAGFFSLSAITPKSHINENNSFIKPFLRLFLTLSVSPPFSRCLRSCNVLYCNNFAVRVFCVSLRCGCLRSRLFP